MKIKIGKNKRKCKGQVKMIETVMVLLVLVFLFGLLMIFYAKFQVFQIDKIAKEVEEKRASSLLNKIIGMPELRCSLSFGTASEINCLDTYKLLAFTSPVIKDKFSDEFSGLSNVKIVREYPPNSLSNIGCSFANNYPKNCGYWQLFDSGKKARASVDTFVTLCTPKEAALNECEIGRLIIEIPLNE